MFKMLVAVLLATSTASAAALAHGSMVGPCGPISPRSLANAELLATPANATEPAGHPGKHLRRHGEHG
jgi:hypothetical protein